MNHLMLDLETMGTRPGCAVVSIGAVAFDFNIFEIKESFYQIIGLTEQQNQLGFTFEASTVKWWLQQTEEARKELLEPDGNLSNILQTLSSFILQNNVQVVWGNSTSFDCRILEEVYKRVGIAVPWDRYRGERCYKTLFRLVMIELPESEKIITIRKKINFMIDVRKTAEQHNALADAKFQVVLLEQLLKAFA